MTESKEETKTSTPWSAAQLKKWKAEFGDTNIHAIRGFDENTYVIRGIGRAEFQDLANKEFKNEDEMENEFVTSALLFPEMSLSDIRTKSGGFVPQLFEKIMNASNVDPQREYIASELPVDSKDVPEELQPVFESADIKSVDITEWIQAWGKVYFTVMENKLFVYHALRRSDFEKFKEAQRKGDHFGPQSEEALVMSGFLYPYEIDPSTNDFLHGTISALSNYIYAASGFNAPTTIETL